MQSAESWQAWAIGIIDQRIHQAMSLGGMICHPVGKVIGIKSREVREYAHDEIKCIKKCST